MLEIIGKNEEARRCLMLGMTDGGCEEAIAALHTLALDFKGKVAEIDAAAKGQAKAEKVNPLDVKYGKDEAGKKAAEAFLRQDGGVFDLITDYCGEDAGRTFHLHAAMRDLAMKYLSDEVSFFTAEITPKVAKVSRKAEYKADFNEVRKLIAHIVGIGADKKFKPATCEYITKDKQGNYVSVIGGMKGARKNTGGVTGRYAKLYNLAWTIDGEEVEWQQINDICRILWTGASRIGKNAKTLTEILDKQTTWDRPDFTSKDLTINGHKVTVSRLTDEDDEEEEEEEAEQE